MTQDTDKFSKLLLEQVKGATHVDLLIIKGHILVEYVMNKFIDTFSKHNQAAQDIRFTFYQKIHVCKILGLFYSNESDRLEQQVLILNKLRNEIAHKLSFKRSLLEDLFRHYPDEENVLERFKPKTRDLKKLRWIIVYICAFLLGRLDGKKGMQQTLSELEKSKL